MDSTLNVELPSPEAVELAADFIEQELGRYDWMNNWKAIQPADAKIAAWLRAIGSDVPADHVRDAIVHILTKRPRPWMTNVTRSM